MRFPLGALLRFLSVLAVVLTPVIAFSGLRLRAGWPWDPAQSAWAWAVPALIWGFPIVTVLFLRGAKPDWIHSLAFILLGVAATTFMLLLAATLGDWALGHPLPRTWPWGALLLAAAFSLLGWRAAFAPAEVRRLDLPIAGLPGGLQGLRIVQISDLHISGLVGAAEVDRLVAQVNAAEPDLIAVTGDLVDGPVAALSPVARSLGALKAPLGVFYVTGNHEYFWGVDAWLSELRGLGWQLLLNEHRSLSHGGSALRVLGVNDPTAAQLGAPGPDLRAALAGAPEAPFTLFLAHQPSAYPLAEAAGAQLFLAGHTHGGQFFPFNLLIGFFHKYAQGLHRHNGTWVYVHRGSGFWGPPSRLGVPPEIAVLTLSAAPE